MNTFILFLKNLSNLFFDVCLSANQIPLFDFPADIQTYNIEHAPSEH